MPVPLPLLSLLAGSTSAGAAFAWSLVLSGAVVVASLIPLGAARSQADFTPADLAAPRAMFERLPAWGKRANWAHQNSFEAFTLHAPACLLALSAATSGAGLGSSDLASSGLASSGLASSGLAVAAAWLHPALRLAYIGAYVANVPPLRSLCWAGAILCTAILYSEGLRGVLHG